MEHFFCFPVLCRGGHVGTLFLAEGGVISSEAASFEHLDCEVLILSHQVEFP